MNLVLNNVLKRACSNAIKVVNNVLAGLVNRYVKTRWNSIYDRLVDIVNRNICETHEQLQFLQRAITLVKPIIDLLDYSQGKQGILVHISPEIS